LLAELMLSTALFLLPMLSIGICWMPIGSAAAGTGSVTNTLNYRDILECGPNSLYMFLVMSGHSEADLGRLRELPLNGTEGTSMLTLCDGAKLYGVDTEVRHYRVDEIDRVPLPAIGHVQTSLNSQDPWHFDVIYKVDPTFVYLLDGTSGYTNRIRRTKLADFWSGDALVEKKSFWKSLVTWLAIPAAAVAGVGACAMFTKARSRSRFGRSGAGKRMAEQEGISVQ